MKTRSALTALALTAAAIAWTGCGTTCPTETPQVQRIASCSVQGSIVTANLTLCPTCNQTPITCSADLSGAASGQIHLDPLAEACEGSTSCPAPSCATAVPCSFQAPSASGTYTLFVIDPVSGQTREAQLVVSGGSVSCTTI